MITLERVKKEIAELKENGCMTAQNVHDLAALYWIEEKMQCKEAAKGWVVAAPIMTKSIAERWVHKMKNADGSTGEHWTYEQTEEVRRAHDVVAEPTEFYATMNMLWSDYGEVAERFGVNNVDFWADLSAAFVDDVDAAPEKVERYYRYVTER